MASIRSGIGEFQSTLPREERLFHNCFEHVFNYFNPRSHERSDIQIWRLWYSVLISIHAPTRGATVSWFVSILIERISIHAPTRGATVTTIFVMTDAQFQSTLPREERRITHNCVIFCFIFQSTLPREERLKHSL